MKSRLTKKISKTIQDKYSLGSYLYYDFANADDTNKLLNKLGAFEDFMEKYNIKSIEDLQLRLEDVEHYSYNCNCEQIEEIIRLKNRWQELKKFVDNQANNYDEGISSVCCLIYEKMQELEQGEEND